MSLPVYHVGEIAICNGASPRNDRYRGQECEVVQGFATHECVCPTTGLVGIVGGYVVRFSDGREFVAMSSELRKRFEPGDWSRLSHIWQPRPVERGDNMRRTLS